MNLIFKVWIIFFVGMFSAKDRKDSMESFKWLLGDWKMIRKNGQMIESWKRVNDSSFEGKSFFINQAGERKMLEEMQLILRKQSYHFVSAVPGQNQELPVSFAIQKFTESGFVAENPDHDFPKRITYELIKSDSLHAWIDGGAQNPDKKVDFYFSRQNQ